MNFRDFDYIYFVHTGVKLDIVDSNIPDHGRLQITFEGRAGSLGTDEWSDNDAYIACRQMGYADGQVTESESGVQPYYLDRLICYNDKIDSILKCSNKGWGKITENITKSAYLKCHKYGKFNVYHSQQNDDSFLISP